MKHRIFVVVIVAFGLVCSGCSGSADDSAVQSSAGAPQQASQPLDPVAIAKHAAAFDVAAVTGDQRAARANMQAYADDYRRSMKIPDPARPIDHEAARAALRPLPGVRSSVWMDQSNLIVMVAGAQYRTMQTIDRVCNALASLGDTLAVVVNVQDVSATTSEGADTLSRNCQLPEEQRAFLQPNRKIDVLDPTTRRAFQAQQDGPRR